MNHFERPTRREETLVNFREATEKIKSLSQYKINPEDFSDLYNPANIKSDQELADRLRRKFDIESERDENLKEAKKLAEILEYIVYDQGESSNWFGEYAYMIKTSDYDDFKNGVDVVAEFDLGDSVSRTGLVIDATFGHSPRKKIEKIKSEISQGINGYVKYFESGDGNYRGELRGVPKIFVGSDPENTKKLINLWISENHDDKKSLADHPIQVNFLKQVILQCEYFAEFAKEMGQDGIADSYSRLGRVIQKIWIEKGCEEKVLLEDEFMDACETYFRGQ